MSCPLRSPPHPYVRIFTRHDDLSTASSSTSLRSDLHPPRCPVHCVLLHILTLGSSSATMTCPLRSPPHPYARILLRHDDLSTASSSTSLRSDLHPPRCPVHCVLLHILTLGSSSSPHPSFLSFAVPCCVCHRMEDSMLALSHYGPPYIQHARITTV